MVIEHVLWLTAEAASASGGWRIGNAEAWWTLLGRLHVLSVHFPIALVIIGALIEIARLPRRKAEPPRKWRPSGAGLACIIIGALMGGIVAWSGWVYADELGASGDEVTLHRWAGIIAAGVAGVAAVVGLVGWFSPDRARLAGYRFLALVGAVGVGVAGHFGGSLVHGSRHISEPLRLALGLAQPGEPEPVIAEEPAEPEPAEPAQTAPAQPQPEAAEDEVVVAAVSFDQVQPILENACYRCHGPERQRGRLRLDTDEGLFSVVAAGDRVASELYDRINLPADDPDRMPKGDDPLPAEDIELIGAWIDGLSAAAAPAEPEQPAEEIGQPQPADPAPMPTLTEEQRTTRDAALAALRERGLVAQVVAEGVDGCEVRLVGAVEFADEDLALLDGLEGSLLWLDLTGSQVTDAGAQTLGRFPHLRRLRLGETSLTDASMATFGSLKELEMLDLHATQVTDAKLGELAELPRLRSLYLWNTQATLTGAAQLRARSPWLEIDLGTP
ncbi:MAG: c-type cytochrome domain-containing protein [Phycisphaerales bacterium JB039]